MCSRSDQPHCCRDRPGLWFWQDSELIDFYGGNFETLLGGGVAVRDVSMLLPTHKTKKYKSRPYPTELYVHHSGRAGKQGYNGLHNSANYVVRYRDWPGCPYHYWISYDPVIDSQDNLVVFRAQPTHVRTYHAGTGPNTRGIAVCLQGNTTLRPASEFQLECLGALVNYLNLPVCGHCEAPPDGHPKPSCPGTHAMSYLMGYRRRRPLS